MVGLHTFFLAVTLATGPAVACSNEYLRHSEPDVLPYRHYRYGHALAGAFGFQSRALEDDEDLFGRDLEVSDGLEVREPFNFGKVIQMGERVAEHKHTKNFLKGANYGQQIAGAASTYQSRALEDDEDLFGRDLEVSDGLEVREPFNFGKVIQMGERVAKHKHTKNFLKGANYGQQLAGAASTYQSRALEDDEDLFGRDFEVSDGLEAREPFNFGKVIQMGERVAKHKHTKNFLKGANYGQQIAGAASTYQSRSLEDDEDLFRRDLCSR